MAELIDRQAAIDAVLKAIYYDEYWIEQVEMAISELPSAQPEIIRCKECVDYDTSWIPHSAPDRHYCPTMDSFMPDDGYCSFAERRTDGSDRQAGGD